MEQPRPLEMLIMVDNPNWKPILDALPAEMHPLIKPELEKWDQAVNAKFEEIRNEVAPYGDVLKGVNPEYVQQALQVADMIRNDPNSLVSRLNEQMGLGYLTKEEAEALQQQVNTPDGDDDWDGTDIEKHPKFVAMQQALEGINTTLTAQQQRDLEAQQAREFEQYMTTLHETEGDFDDEYVLAIMANTDLDGPSAVAKYREKIAELTANGQQGQANNNNGTPPPVVLDGNGKGSGAEQEVVDFSAMKKSDINDYIAERLKQAAEADQ